VGKYADLIQRILGGRADASIKFSELRQLLLRLGFDERVRGDHHIFTNIGWEWKKMSSKYEIIIYWSPEDEAFIAEVPELPGCMADGGSYQEAVANVESVIEQWIETARELGRPIPAPRGRLTFA